MLLLLLLLCCAPCLCRPTFSEIVAELQHLQGERSSSHAMAERYKMLQALNLAARSAATPDAAVGEEAAVAAAAVMEPEEWRPHGSSWQMAWH